MEIKKTQNGGALSVQVIGRLDTTTAPELEKALSELDSVTALTLDFANLEYISSAGLRVILALQKTMSKKEGMKVCNVNSDIMEVFEITGFSDMLTIE